MCRGAPQKAELLEFCNFISRNFIRLCDSFGNDRAVGKLADDRIVWVDAEDDEGGREDVLRVGVLPYHGVVGVDAEHDEVLVL